MQNKLHAEQNIRAPVETAADNSDNHVNASSGIQQEEMIIAASTTEQLSLDEDMSQVKPQATIPHQC
jgi:hypothetical protein